MLKLKLKSVDRGNSRIYLTANKNLYCLQEQDVGFSLNRCSKDGEPDHKIDIQFVESIEALKESEQLVKSFFLGTLT